MITIPHQALEITERFEGFSATQYRDSVGVLTIGFGTTEADVTPLPKFVTRAQAERFLAQKLQTKYLPPILALRHDFNANEIAALLSFDYNLGPGIFLGSTIGNDLRAGNRLKAASDMLMYDHAGGIVLQGLLNRRLEEQRIFLTPPPAPTDPNHYHRFVDLTMTLSGHRVNERLAVEQYDTLRVHLSQHRQKLKQLQSDCGLLAGRIWTIAHHGLKRAQRPDWAFCYRGWRLQQLLHRRDGRRLGIGFKP